MARIRPAGGMSAAQLAADPALRAVLDLVYASRAYVDTNTAPASLVSSVSTLHDDPLALGHVAGVTAFLIGNAQTWNAAGDVRFIRTLAAGTITRIGLYVEVSSGNISVGVYRRSGSGRAAQPGARALASAALPCPGTGYQEIALGGSVRVEIGDYLALSCDNATASFLGTGGGTRALYAPMLMGQTAGHPLPVTAASPFATGSKVPLLVGIP